jgi:hypothetical protein
LLAELRECLASNDTYAEEIVARLIASSGDRAPRWLAQVNEAIQSLEYELALARLPTLK